MSKVEGVIILLLALIIGALWLTRSKPTPVPARPTLIIHDTVQTIDTVRVLKIIAKQAPPDTVWITKEIVTPPETINVVPPLRGITRLYQPRAIGDTGAIEGFNVVPLPDGKYGMRSWQNSWVSPGPLGSITSDSSGIRLGFYDPPAPACGIHDYAKWGVIGAGGITLLRAILGK